MPRWGGVSALASASAWWQTVYCLASYLSSINASTIVNIMNIFPGRWDENWWIKQFRCEEGCRHWPWSRHDDKLFIVWPVIRPVLMLARFVNIINILPGRWDQNWWINQFWGQERCRHQPVPQHDHKPFVVWPVIPLVLLLAVLSVLYIYYYLAIDIEIDG